MAGHQQPLSDWAAAEAANLPPLTPEQIGAIAAVIRQIDERMAQQGST